MDFYYCQGDGFHAVIQEHNKKHAIEYFVYITNEMLEPEKGISEKDVTCEQVNVYSYKPAEQSVQADLAVCSHCGAPLAFDGSCLAMAGVKTPPSR